MTPAEPHLVSSFLKYTRLRLEKNLQELFYRRLWMTIRKTIFVDF